MKTLIVAAVQTFAEIGEINRNSARLSTWTKRAADEGADIVCFPECCVTGYTTTQASKSALAHDDARLCELRQLSIELGLGIGFGYMEAPDRASEESENGDASKRPFVTYEVHSPAGSLVYRKTHLGSREQEAFSAGNALPVARVCGVNIGVQLCWEAHLPDITTTLRARDVEIVLMPHAVPLGGARRLELWNRYLPARAYDNGVFVVATNALSRAEDGSLQGGGMAAYGPDGLCLSQCNSTEDHMMLVQVGGPLPREQHGKSRGMGGASFFDRRRPELYR